MFAPPILLVLESCMIDKIDCSQILHTIPSNILMKWESVSTILKEGLAKMNWWEKQYPVTYERLNRLWQEPNEHRVWKETIRGGEAVHAFRYDELGSDHSIHQLLVSSIVRTFSWGILSKDSETQSYFDFSKHRIVSKLWTIPFRNMCLVQLENRELVLVGRTQQKLKYQGGFLFATISNGDCFSVLLDGNNVLVIEQVKEQLIECNRIITAMCFVSDSTLLLASSDGIIRGYPRSNLKSEYFVENLESLISHMTSLSNVIAIIHSYCILEVRHHFNLLYRYKGVDCEHAPLLYGPYVIFAALDGLWYRVLYDGNEQVREEIKIPHLAGWKIISVKNANWKYLTIVVQNPRSKKIEELFLFS